MASPRRALVLVDIQQQYFDGPLEIHYPSITDSLAKTTAAIAAATEAGMPVVVVQHDGGEGAPVFSPGSASFALRPEIERLRTDDWKHVVKQYSSVYPGTGLAEWLRERDIDTVTLAGYMTNNCILASAAEAEVLGFTTEVLSDATGAIHLSNAAGSASATTVHQTLMALLQSNWAAVASTDEWLTATAAGTPVPASNLVESAIAGAQHAVQS